jgi:multidrug transporter EmrE-like cation transporter
MFLFYFSILLAILSTLLYHLSQKLTPGSVNPVLAITITYLVSLAICLAILAFSPPSTGLRASLSQLNWASIALAFALVGLEIGFLLAYRAGWNLSTATIFVNTAGTLLLIPVGLFFFKERLTPVNLFGILVCIAGLILINWRR